ncbi:hypothetical protein HS125_03525 [bacterium]|nr:hypothetical protein [bacterium]
MKQRFYRWVVAGLAATLACQPGWAQVTIVGSPQNYTTIAAAVAAAGPNATIEVSAAGTYSQESFSISNSGITIRGVNGTPVISATSQWMILSPGFTMENLRFEFGRMGANPIRAGFFADDFTARNCTFIDPGPGSVSANRIGNAAAAAAVSCALTVECRNNVLIGDCTFSSRTRHRGGQRRGTSLRRRLRPGPERRGATLRLPLRPRLHSDRRGLDGHDHPRLPFRGPQSHGRQRPVPRRHLGGSAALR